MNIINILSFVLGIVSISGGLYLFAKVASLNKSTWKIVLSALPLLAGVFLLGLSLWITAKLSPDFRILLNQQLNQKVIPSSNAEAANSPALEYAEGEIVSVNRCSFLVIFNPDSAGAAAGSFYYDIISIRDKNYPPKENRVYSVFIPYTSNYYEGNKVAISYIPFDKKPSFRSIFKKYMPSQRSFITQKGYIESGGVINLPESDYEVKLAD